MSLHAPVAAATGPPRPPNAVVSLIASDCAVCADLAALDLFSLSVANVGHINEMVNRGMNKYDISNLTVAEINLET